MKVKKRIRYLISFLILVFISSILLFGCIPKVTELEEEVTYTITASAGDGGTISETGVTTINEGDSKSYTITTDEGYEVYNVLVNDISEGALSSYTFTDVTSDQTIEAIFALTYNVTAKDKVKINQPSVCFITTYYYAYVYNPNTASWSELYYYGPTGGTGFCVNPDTGHILTAGHVIDVSHDDIKWAILDLYIFEYYPDEYYNLTDGDWNWIYDNYKVEGESGPNPDREVWVQFNTASAGLPDSPDETYIRAEVIDFSPREQRDIAVIKITPVTGRALSSTILGDSSMIEIQDNITITGYPWNAGIAWESIMTPTIATGTISARKMVGGTEVLQVDMTAAPGNSGSPVLSEDGKVIGMLTMGTTENVNFLRPSNDIKGMLNKNGVTNKLGMVDEEFKQGLVMYRLKHYSEAIDHFNAVINLSQGHLLAQEYRAKSQEAINRDEDIPLKEGTEINIIE